MTSAPLSIIRAPDRLERTTSLAHRSQLGLVPLALVAMPWPPIYSPYLAISTLAACAKKVAGARKIDQHHLYLDWYAALLQEYGDFAAELYSLIAESGAYAGIGDFIFGGYETGRENEINEYLTTVPLAREIPDIRRMIGLARSFIAAQAERLAARVPRGAFVGLSSTFTQTTPSVALARGLKQHRPDVTICLGGSNMSPPRAEVILRNYAFVDHVVFGEGENSLVALLQALDSGEASIGIDGVASRSDADALVCKDSPTFVQLDDWPAPDFGPYFEQLVETGVDAVVEPKLAYEIARGCWWGAKHHCTFCGLNGESMAFRRKSSEKALNDLTTLIGRHRNLDIIFADNILHPTDTAALFAKLPQDIDLRMHLEVKSNMRRADMKTLRDSGVWHLQPGIESLARRPLELMRKGVTPLQNVRFLRDAEELGITVSWNIITGFPGETARDYAEMLEQLRNLRHLQPPGSVAPLALVRYSPLFNDPSLGFVTKRPARFNHLVFNEMNADDVEVMSEVFDGDMPHPPGEGLTDAMVALDTEVRNWNMSYGHEFLAESAANDFIQVVRIRDGSQTDALVLNEVWSVQAWNHLRQGRTAHGVRSYIEALTAREARLTEELVEEVISAGLVWRDEGGLVTLPARYESHIPHRLLG